MTSVTFDRFVGFQAGAFMLYRRTRKVSLKSVKETLSPAELESQQGQSDKKISFT